jgi:hypothetical protein
MATIGARAVRWIAVASMTSAVACSTDTAGLDESTAQEPVLILSDTAASVAGVVVSTAIASHSAVVTAASASADADQVAYISLPPGTLPSGVTATIRNRVTGIGLTVTIIDGGFDPVPIAAVAGDVLDIEVRLAGSAAPQMYSLAVPGKRRPKVVRTNPPRGKRDVALNATIQVVFSEPIDARTLTDTSVRLEHDGAPVAGSLAFEDAAQLSVVITPLASFEEGAEYRLIVTQDVRDLDGEPLEAPVTVEFTAASIGASAVGRIAFADWNTISVINTDGTGLTSLIDDDGQGWTYMSPAWSPDGSQIAFGSSRDGGWDIYVINADGSGLRRLTTHGARDDSPAWSPDGSQIAFTSDRDGDFEIHVMNADGSNIRRVTDHPAEDGDPSWSPDGSMIAFTSNRDGPHEIYVVNVDGTDTRRVTTFPDPSMVIQPAWSPAANTIVFTVTEAFIGVYRVDLDGGSPVRLSFGGGGPAWSPDGAHIVYAEGNLQVMNADATGRRDLGVFGYEPSWGVVPR